jgi:hypothetical protein
MLTALFIASAGFSFGATLNVPSTLYPSLDDAITSAVDGDTVIINDNGVYSGTLGLAKRIKIKAALGKNPTICAGSSSKLRIWQGSAGADAASGLKIGDNSGGRINVGDGTNSTYYCFDYNVSTGTVTLENLFMHFNTQRCFLESGATSIAALNMTDVDINLSNRGGTGWGMLYYGDGELNMTRVTIIGQARPLVLGSGKHFRRVNLDSCIIGDLDDTLMSVGLEKIQSGSGTIDATDCLFLATSESNVNNAAVVVSEYGCTMTLTRCGLVNYGVPVTGTSSNNFAGLVGTYPAAALMVQAWAPCPSNPYDTNKFGNPINPADANDVRIADVTVDHCDLISSGSALLVPDAGTTGRVVRITNSNLIALDDDPCVTGTINAFDSVDLDYCNVINLGSGVRFGGDITAGDLTNGQELDPGYNDIGNKFSSLNYTYTNLTLKTADDSGNPIGLDISMAGQVPVELSTFQLQ